MRASLFGEIVRDVVGHGPRQQDAVGPDRARHRHRHHVDRRHDGRSSAASTSRSAISISELGPDTIYVAEVSGLSSAAGRQLPELAASGPTSRRTTREAIERSAPSIAIVDSDARHGGPWRRSRGLLREPADQAAHGLRHHRATGRAPCSSRSRGRALLHARRRSAPAQHVVVLGQTAGRQRSSRTSIRSARRSASAATSITVDRRDGEAAESGRVRLGADDFVVMPLHDLREAVRQSAAQPDLATQARSRSVMIAAVPRGRMREPATARSRSR